MTAEFFINPVGTAADTDLLNFPKFLPKSLQIKIYEKTSNFSG